MYKTFKMTNYSQICDRICNKRPLAILILEPINIKKKIDNLEKGQNVKNHFVESQKKNIESLKFRIQNSDHPNKILSMF